MPFFKIRTALREILPKELASNGQFALEHVLDAISRENKIVTAVRYNPENKREVICDADLIELITLWKFGYELKNQDPRVHAMIAKLLRIEL